MRTTAFLGGALAATAASLILTAPAMAAHTGGALIPAKAHEVLPVHGGTATSLNWSGYAVTPSSAGITAVNSSFVVPSASLLIPGFAATWTGIGGYSSSDLIQAGVSENELLTGTITGAQYQAWYEILPADETPITGCSGDASCTVSPGDDVSVNIHLVSGDTWSISMVDSGKWTWSQDITYASSESSAEWILEAPTVDVQSLLADVGNVSFSGDNYTQNGTTYTIAQGDPTTIDLSPLPVALPDGLLDEATPSALGPDGESFNDCAYALSCTAPSS